MDLTDMQVYDPVYIIMYNKDIDGWIPFSC